MSVSANTERAWYILHRATPSGVGGPPRQKTIEPPSPEAYRGGFRFDPRRGRIKGTIRSEMAFLTIAKPGTSEEKAKTPDPIAGPGVLSWLAAWQRARYAGALVTGSGCTTFR